MITRVYKYDMSLFHGSQSLSLPIGVKYLDCQIQYGNQVIWVEEPLGAARETICFNWIWTGEDIPEGAVYLKTYLELNSGLVWHLYCSKDIR